ncbi:hypothetical protein O181_032688 [Austropuccinia psidii MF-1]|uniref:Uncharacterized protein n=1 Tax=Austropuccinia psidii MF-1 TaxID=1389203 RepID=A0A9Q3D237_9BASI|nr:hypothetical protein [Austropuccinia psidii MF-1]
MQILTPIQNPSGSQMKPCAVNLYTREAYQQCQQCLTLVQAPDSSHTNPYAFPGSQIFKLLIPGKPPNNSNTSLDRCRLPMLQMQILMFVQVPDNLNNSLPWRSRLKILKTP